ncbi:hypothetical protein JCM17960_31640 [Magnetospira thiophila]
MAALHGFFPSPAYAAVRDYFEARLGPPSYSLNRETTGTPRRIVGWRNQPSAGGAPEILEIQEHAPRAQLGVTPDHGVVRVVRSGDVDGIRFLHPTDVTTLAGRMSPPTP